MLSRLAALVGAGDETHLAQDVVEIVSGEAPAALEFDPAPEPAEPKRPRTRREHLP